MLDITVKIYLADEYELCFNNYNYEWSKDWDQNAKSQLHWSAFVVDGVGSRVTWDNVEVVAQASADPIQQDHIQQEYYHYLPGPLTDLEFAGIRMELIPTFNLAQNAICVAFGGLVFR